MESISLYSSPAHCLSSSRVLSRSLSILPSFTRLKYISITILFHLTTCLSSYISISLHPDVFFFPSRYTSDLLSGSTLSPSFCLFLYLATCRTSYHFCLAVFFLSCSLSLSICGFPSLSIYPNLCLSCFCPSPPLLSYLFD